MAEQSELHDLLVGRFVRDVMGPAIKNGATYAQLMVIFESVTVSMLEILNRHYELTPQVATGLCEATLQAAIERFADHVNGRNAAHG